MGHVHKATPTKTARIRPRAAAKHEEPMKGNQAEFFVRDDNHKFSLAWSELSREVNATIVNEDTL